MAKKIIVWFRNDLRSHDHEALHRASQAQVIPIYCFDPRGFGQTRFGFPKTGAFRAKFLLESVSNLRANLRSLGADLIIRQGLPEVIIPELAMQIGATDVYFHEETTSEEIKVEANVINNLTKLGIKNASFWAHTLYHLDDLVSSLPLKI
jgi:deoxyribodipyrimidine photo-lyase